MIRKDDASPDPFVFATKLVNILRYGSFTSTYKYAVLLGLMDLCVEFNAQGGAPASVTTQQLAERVIDLYWPHSYPFVREQGDAQELFQNSAHKHVAAVSEIIRWRARHAPAAMPLSRARSNPAFARLRAQIEWKLVQMPLPRLQRTGGGIDRFLYRINWEESITRGAFNDRSTRGFDNRILFEPRASEMLIRVSPFLRPMIQREWAALVARFNDFESHALESFLFGTRASPELGQVCAHLLPLQDSRCFYCTKTIRSKPQVDHFIPVARHADHRLDNLVVAHASCNGSKSDYLADTHHLLAWAERLVGRSDALEGIATELEWPRESVLTRNIVHTLYGQVTPDAMLWHARKGSGAAANWLPVDKRARERAFALMKTVSTPAC